MASGGKRAGPRKKARLRPSALLLSIGVTLAVVAWGYLVKAAIDFGVEARTGNADAWLYLGLACLGAVACLFVGLMLIARLLRVLGVTSRPAAPPPPEDVARPSGSSGSHGGHRARR